MIPYGSVLRGSTVQCLYDAGTLGLPRAQVWLILSRLGTQMSGVQDHLFYETRLTP